MLNSGRLGIVQSEVEAVLALLWREQHEKVAKNTKSCYQNLGFLVLSFARSIRSQVLRPTQMLRIYQLSPYKV